MQQTTPIIIAFPAYGGLLLLAAALATGATHNVKDYVLGGRRLNAWLAALGAGASDMSSWLLMALPGTVFVNGMQKVWLPVALVIGAYCNWRFVAARLRLYTEIAGDSLTIPAFLQSRFCSYSLQLRIATSLVITIFFIFYAAAGFISGAVLLENIFNINYNLALAITAVVIISYIVTGGFMALTWADFFQGMLMFAAILVVPVVAVNSVGGLDVSFNALAAKSGMLSPFTNFTWFSFFGLAAWGLGYFGQPHIQVRFMAMQDAAEVPVARRICMTWMVLSLVGAILVGLVGSVFYKNGLAREETVFIELARELFNPWLTGVLLAAVLAAILSTISAQVLMTGSILVDDFYAIVLKRQPNQTSSIKLTRFFVLIISACSVMVAAFPGNSIMNVVGFAWAGLGASIGPVLLLSLYWRRMTALGAIAGIVVGGSSVIICELLLKYWATAIGAAPGFPLFPGFICSLIAIIVVSRSSSEPESKVVAAFDAMHRQVLK